MNKTKLSIYASLALALGAMTSCTDKMDNWDVDPAFDRLFTATSLSVTPESTTAAIEFGKVPGATKYQVQVSADSLHNGIAADAEGLVNFELTNSPDTLRGLIGDSYYYLRIRSLGDNGKCSSWRYYQATTGKGSFHTKAEQILNAVADTDRDEDWIRVSWPAGLDVTHLMVKPAGGEELRVDLDAEAKAAGSYKLTGLAPSTSYTIDIYYNDAKRGTVTASTTAAAPAGNVKYTLKTGESITNELMKQLEEQGKAFGDTYSVTIIVPAGATIDAVGTAEDGTAASIKIPDGMSVTFFGAAGEVPHLNLSKSINLAGSHAYVKFQNLDITDGGCQYFINQSAEATIGQLTFQDCNIHDLDRSIIRLQGAVIAIDKVVLDNCVCTNISSGNSYSGIYFGDAKNAVGEVSITNCTFDTGQRSFIEASKTCVPTINILNTTIYNNVETGRYLIDANGQNTNITLSGVILGKTHHAETARGIRTAGTISVDNCIRTNDCVFSANDIKDLPAGENPSSYYFKDPENHDFTLKVDVKCGDPRWYMPAE